MENFKASNQARVIVKEKDTDDVLIQRDTSFMTAGVGNKHLYNIKHRYNIHTFDGNEKEIKPDSHLYESLSKYVGETVLVEGVNNEDTVFKVNYRVSKKGDSIILSVAE